MTDLLWVAVWLFAATGWLLDWVTTVWPTERVVEANPLVVSYVGRQPDPIRFGLAKVASLAAFGLLSRLLGVLVSLDDAVPAAVLGLRVALWLPVGVGVLGWAATLHNLRTHWRSART